MAVDRLCSGAEACIQIMQLDSRETTETVRTCLLNYTRPHSCSGSLSWIAYRIVQAVKSIFGKSDWQVARTAVQKSLLGRAYQYGLIQENPGNPQISVDRRPIERQFKERGQSTLMQAADEFISLALVSQTRNCENTPELARRLWELNNTLFNGLQTARANVYAKMGPYLS